MKPYILSVCKSIPAEETVLDEQYYDEAIQCWIDSRSGDPVVTRQPGSASKFGETTMTETREGADQSEVASFAVSQFGETTITKTAEGVDQTEIADGALAELSDVAYSHF